MRMKAKGLAALAVVLAAGGCAAPEAKVARAVNIPAPPAPRYSPVGLETVIGRTARYLENQFGKADLEVREGTARKLQFSGPACVLDAYLYPPKAGGEPIVTHVDARRLDGSDFDRASCAMALVKKAQ
jgi:hypothetical protein